MKLEYRSGCPIASTLDILGDRWTLVLIRDMLNGKSKYSEFLDSPERITTNVLADRLAKMEANGIVKKTLYLERPKRYAYELSTMGKGLHPVLKELCRWGNKFIPDTWIPPRSFMR